VLYEVKGKSLLQYLFDAVKQCKLLDDIVIATSKEKSDNPIEYFCRRHNMSCYRGQLDNVASRYKDILACNKTDTFVRLCADSPMLDYRLIDSALNVYQKGQYDIVTNIFQRSFPKGQSVEIVNARKFLNGYDSFDSKEDFEHVTKFFYRNAVRYKINNFFLDHNHSNISLAVDTPEDLEIFQRMISDMNKPHWEYCLEEIIKIYHQIMSQSIH
jgi:spore coat polysaccharide biosynthesis protein SpsF (cytidylyltransferase family)